MFLKSTRTPSEVRSSPLEEFVADEQLVNDPLHLPGVEQDQVAPPFLELEEAGSLGVDFRIQAIKLGPVGVGGLQGFEIGDEVGAVEPSIAEVAGQRRQPGAAEQASCVSHRRPAVYACPVGQRRARHHHRADDIGANGAHHHDLPAGLTIADQAGFASCFRVELGDRGDEPRLGATDILDSLPWDRIFQEADKVARMPGPKHLADLAVILHPANARALTGARIEHDERALAGIDRDPGGRLDANQNVVHRPLERSAVHHHVGCEVQHGG